MIKKFICTGVNKLAVYYTDELDGGGTTFGQDYITTIKQRYPNRTFAKCYEWCSGPGFIGFSILDHGLCRELCLSDLYAPALEMTELTAKKCTASVSSYVLDDLAMLPDNEIFDLVVSNPPHFSDSITDDYHRNRICSDLDWEAHKNFYANIKRHLTTDGIILIQENSKGSSLLDFESMIDKAGLQVTDCFNSVRHFYYIEIKHK